MSRTCLTLNKLEKNDLEMQILQFKLLNSIYYKKD